MPHSTARPSPFPQTAWSQVLTARDAQSQDARMAREEVCRAYWTPVYSYFRALGCDREDAPDLTQELLADFCDGGGLERVTPDVGSLRSYLKGTAQKQDRVIHVKARRIEPLTCPGLATPQSHDFH